MKYVISLVLAALLFPGISRAQNGSVDNSPISSFDLSRYLGTWYEIARFDHSFERGMQNVSAEYLLRDDGMVAVFNSGWKDGKYKVAEGKAKQPDPTGDPAALKVSFFMFFFNDYDVLMLDDNYQIALVGSKSPNYLWILSRDPSPSDEVVGEVVEEADRRGYDTSKLIWVEQGLNDVDYSIIL